MNHYDAVTVNGVLLRLAMAESKLWVRRTDFAKALKYSSSAVDNQLLKVEIEHCKKDGFKFIDEFAARQVCLLIPKAPGGPAVLKWLNSGGMSMHQTRESTSSTHAHNQMAAVSKGVSSSYCENLVLAFFQHANKDEVKRFVQFVECEVAGILTRRPCKELNDARHDLYRRFYLQGGEK
ncbi:hypothetical protein NDR77_32820 [Pseudomonas aeruginosa]|uniref:hypothetical protein n=1 Tax=Pseudomonas aeruginosa TaxID=287 RepID=UPI00129543F8|nr:hypothetical protein [Pseudomonas aeruginosa]MBG5579636.1 hypothetical protein [Pseudomonas aeruginosa]MBG5688909.1 hypothetical protein [Pseudomonas aeruginosa]MCM5670700.1 hypothetical protein [Pseudomonas aeruginosa]HBN7643448.1 hypothetical protein [Pseudomonas aeruginosa]HBN7784208.1 hypothetical protein [Pseudomonas aeruginosa]